MKIILLIQTLIIIVGGYFLYQEIMVDEVVTEVEVAETTTQEPVAVPAPLEIEVPTTTRETPTITEDLDGHNDQGMEWPVLETEGGVEMQ